MSNVEGVATDSDGPGSFVLHDWNPVVRVTLPDGLASHEVLHFKAFNDWKESLKISLEKQKMSDHPFYKDPYKLRTINVHSFDRAWGGRLLFVKLVALIQNTGSDKQEQRTLPGAVFLRGGSVAVLMILRPFDDPDERYVVITEQPRPASGSLRFMEIPAGMLDDMADFVGAAARKIEEEVGLRLNKDELVDMTSLALQGYRSKEYLRDAMYPSPGACDEFISIFLWEQEKERMEIHHLKDRLEGSRAEQENISVRLVKYEKLLQIGVRDAKTLAAWSLYEYLKRTKLLDKHIGRHD